MQDQFDAVVHYDLPWNPNRLEQREGRVDRFGQPRDEVKAVLLFGANNQVDQVVLEVLLRKARRIRSSLGIAVPVPVEAERVVQTVVDNVLLRRQETAQQLELAFATPDVSRLHAEWDKAADREKKQRGYFRQQGIQPEEVAREIKATDNVLGDRNAVRRFLGDALQRFGGRLERDCTDDVFKLSAGGLGSKLATVAGEDFPLRVTFDRRKDQDALYLGRTHPLVALVCDSVLGEAFGPAADDRFARAGAMYTDAVGHRTVLLLLRFRYLLHETTDEFAEEIVLAGFRREDGAIAWIEPFAEAPRALVEAARPVANMEPAERQEQIAWALEFLAGRADWHKPLTDWRLGELQAAHDRLRRLMKARTLTVDPHSPPDILGCFVLVPAGGRA